LASFEVVQINEVSPGDTLYDFSESLIFDIPAYATIFDEILLQIGHFQRPESNGFIHILCRLFLDGGELKIGGTTGIDYRF